MRVAAAPGPSALGWLLRQTCCRCPGAPVWVGLVWFGLVWFGSVSSGLSGLPMASSSWHIMPQGIRTIDLALIIVNLAMMTNGISSSLALSSSCGAYGAGHPHDRPALGARVPPRHARPARRRARRRRESPRGHVAAAGRPLVRRVMATMTMMTAMWMTRLPHGLSSGEGWRVVTDNDDGLSFGEGPPRSAAARAAHSLPPRHAACDDPAFLFGALCCCRRRIPSRRGRRIAARAPPLLPSPSSRSLLASSSSLRSSLSSSSSASHCHYNAHHHHTPNCHSHPNFCSVPSSDGGLLLPFSFLLGS